MCFDLDRAIEELHEIRPTQYKRVRKSKNKEFDSVVREAVSMVEL